MEQNHRLPSELAFARVASCVHARRSQVFEKADVCGGRGTRPWGLAGSAGIPEVVVPLAPATRANSTS